MWIIFFDPGVLLIIILFLVVGTVGAILQNLTTILLTIFLTIAVIALFLYLTVKFGGKGIFAFFMGLVVLIIGAFAIDYFGDLPQSRYNKSVKENVWILKADKAFQWVRSSTDAIDVKKDSVIVLGDTDYGKTHVTIYYGYSISFADSGSKEGISGYYPLTMVTKTNNAAIHNIEDALKSNALSWDSDELTSQIRNSEQVLLVKSNARDKTQIYTQSMIGKTYSDFEWIDYYHSRTNSGEKFYVIKLKIIDEDTLEYIDGYYVGGHYATDLSPISVNEAKKLPYQIKKNIFGAARIVINNGQYSYKLIVDDNFNVKGLDIYSSSVQKPH